MSDPHLFDQEQTMSKRTTGKPVEAPAEHPTPAPGDQSDAGDQELGEEESDMEAEDFGEGEPAPAPALSRLPSGPGPGLAVAPVVPLGLSTAQHANAQRAAATIQAKLIVARAQPRSANTCRSTLVEAVADHTNLVKDKKGVIQHECWYRKPQGSDTVDGFSVRFAELAYATWGNMDQADEPIEDTDTFLLMRLTIHELESNATQSEVYRASKFVERRQPKTTLETIAGKNQKVDVPPHHTRQGASGQTVYVYEASDDELEQNISRAKSKAFRDCVLKLLPPAVKAECRSIIEAMLASAPAANRRGLELAYGAFGLSTQDMEKVTGKPLKECGTAQYRDLLNIYQEMLKTAQGVFQKTLMEKKEV